MKLEDTELGKPMPTSAEGIFLANIGKEAHDRIAELTESIGQVEADLGADATEAEVEAETDKRSNDFIFHLLNEPVIVDSEGKQFENTENREYVEKLPLTLKARMMSAVKEGFSMFAEKHSPQGTTG